MTDPQHWMDDESCYPFIYNEEGVGLVMGLKEKLAKHEYVCSKCQQNFDSPSDLK